MALNKTTMAATIVSNLQAVAPVTDPAKCQAYFEAICDGIIKHLIADAVITVDSVSGVTTGGSNSGTGTGEISS